MQQRGRAAPPAAGGVFKSAAVDVLRRERRLMSTGDICRLALERGLLTCSGKTPEATMASALYGDLKRRERESLFIRPQEGLFGLREWAEQGLLAHGQPQLQAQPPLLAKQQQQQQRQQQQGVDVLGSSAGRKKVCRSQGAPSQEQERHSSEGEPASDSDERLEPRCTAQRKMPAGHLRDVPAAAAAALVRRTSSQEQASDVTVLNSRSQPRLQLPLPLCLPNLRPPSAAGSHGFLDGHHAGSGGAGAGLLSPPLCAVLQSPCARPPPASSGGATGFLSPCSGLPDFRSPLAALPLFGTTPAGLPGLLSPCPQLGLASAAPQQQQQQQQRPGSSGSIRQQQLASALKGAASCATVAPAGPGTAPAAMVPLCEASVTAARHLGLPSLLALDLPLPPPQQPLWAPLAGLQAGAAGPCTGGVPEIVFRPPALGLDGGGSGGSDAEALLIRVFRQTDAAAAAAAAGGSPAAAAAAGGGGGGGRAAAAAAAIERKIAALEGKVQAVEAKWGPLSLKTGRAYFLLSHACRHPAAAGAPPLHRKGRDALQRAREILRACRQLGLAGSAEFESLAAEVGGGESGASGSGAGTRT